MLYAYDPIEQQHTKDGHPENHGRLAGTMALLDRDGILREHEAVTIERAIQEQLEWIHPPSYIDLVREVASSGGGQLDPDTYCVADSFEIARTSAGAAMTLATRVMTGSDPHAISLMRPPGHHALAHQAMGFCIFANVVLAAKAAQRAGAERVLIVDWDVHHGNGTEAITIDDPSIAFFSTHQYPYYPGTGAIDVTGTGAGQGATMNVPLPAGVGDAGYARIFESLLVPYTQRIEPDFIVVSAGYDAHWRDPLAQEQLSLAGFARLQRIVTELAERHAEGRLLLVLEGGYDLEVLPHAIVNSCRLLVAADAKVTDPFGAPSPPEVPVDAIIADVKRIHSL